jgi:hypothetical protein
MSKVYRRSAMHQTEGVSAIAMSREKLHVKFEMGDNCVESKKVNQRNKLHIKLKRKDSMERTKIELMSL